MIVRQATLADARRIAEIHVETWRAADPGQIPGSVLDGLDIGQREIFWSNHLVTRPLAVWVAECEGGLTGFCDFIPSRDKDSHPNETGEIAEIYVHPHFSRQGAGLALCHRALKQARLQRYRAVTLWVLSSNTAARNFYESVGFRLDGTVKIDHSLERYELHEIRYKIPL